MAIYGYCRVSTRQQVDDGESLAVQQKKIAGYVMMHFHDCELDDVFIEEGVSGSKPLQARPEGKRLLDTLEAGDVVVAAKLDRMFRSAHNALDLAKLLKAKGVSLHLIDMGGDVFGDAVAKAFFTIVSAFAELEWERICERVLDVKRDQREQGRYLGGAVPFGYDVKVTTGEDGKQDKWLVEDPMQQGVIRQMREWRDTPIEVTRGNRTQLKRRSLRDVSALIESEFDMAVSYQTVKVVLERPKNWQPGVRPLPEHTEEIEGENNG